MTDLDAMAPIHTPQRVSGIQAYHDLIQRVRDFMYAIFIDNKKRSNIG